MLWRWASERRLDVLEPRPGAWFGEDRDDVVADGAPSQPILAEPALGGPADAAGFLVGDRLRREAEFGAGAGLHLADDDAGAVGEDEVQLAFAAAPVAGQQDETPVPEV